MGDRTNDRPITRSSRRLSTKIPTVLKRTSALVPIRFTAKGRSHARKLCMDENAVYAMYFLEHNGTVTYHLTHCGGRDGITFMFDHESCIPEYTRCFG